MEIHIPWHLGSKTKNHDIKIPRPKDRDIKIWGLKHHNIERNKPQHFHFKTFFQRTRSLDIKIPRLKNHDSEIPRLKNHDIEIPRSKPSSSCGILTLMRPDSKARCFISQEKEKILRRTYLKWIFLSMKITQRSRK